MPKDSPGTLDTPEALRAHVGPAMGLAADKVMKRLDPHARRFIALSPFLCLGTSSADGRADVSPRGDAPGFVQTPDDRTLLIPDRPGNRRVDSMANIAENPSVGLIFLVPGIDETLRVNGRASLTADPAILAGMAVEGRTPRQAIRVEIAEVFFHCGKALKRARLWDPATRVERSAFPSLARIIMDTQRPPDLTLETTEALIEDNYRNELY